MARNPHHDWGAAGNDAMDESVSKSRGYPRGLTSREFPFVLLLFGIVVLLCLTLAPCATVGSHFFDAVFGVVLLTVVGSVMGPFAGGNEAEWTRYLEERLKGERDRLMAMLNSMEEGVAIIDPDRKIRFMNPSMVKEFGDGVGLHCYRHLRGFDEPCVDTCKLQDVIKGSIERWEYTLPDKGTYDVISSPFADSDQVPCMLATFRNVTQQKQVELELIELNQLKSDVLSRITRELERASEEVTKLEEEKRRFVRFLSVVAHDLRAPLAATQSCLWTMLDGYAGDITGEQKDLLERGTRRIDGLMILVDDLLDIPRIESGQIVHEMTEISLSEVVERSIDGLDTQAKEKGIGLEVELPRVLPKIYGSSRRLQEVLTNLVGNAIKYTREGTVRIQVIDGDEDVQVEVMDTGIGIPREDLPRLFEDFFRGSNVSVKGDGLGLSISRRIVEAHGGRIWAESPCPETNQGSKFTFVLPKKPGQAGSRGSDKESVQGSR